MSENNQALFVLSTHHHPPPPGSGRAEPEWAEERPGGSGNIGGGGYSLWGGEQGVLYDSWAHNVGIVPSQNCICSPKGGGQRRTELRTSARALGESLCATRLGEREILNAHVAAHPQANLTKVRDAAEKYQCQLPLSQPSPHPSPFDSFSYFSHFISCCVLPGTVILFFLLLTI